MTSEHTSGVATADLSGLRIPKSLEAAATALIELTDRFCADHLDGEYAVLCRRLTARLARKRPSPLERGDLGVWAAAVVHTVGANNFLFDRSNLPYLRSAEIAEGFGVSPSTMANKSSLIRKALRLDPHDVELCRLDVLERHPYAWYVEVDGLVVDSRSLPPELQEVARRRGLVPDLAAAAARR